MERKTYIATIQYDGRNYSGWRRQQHESQTLQQIIEDTLREMTGLKVNLHAASWTDAGVSADGQVAAMVIRSNIKAEEFLEQANALLPADIRILSIESAPRGFDPIGGNLGKHYRYKISTADTCPKESRCWHITEKLEPGQMQAAANKLVGTHDFRGIRQSKDRRKDCVRTITECTIKVIGSDIELHFRGDNFIYLMIRSLTAALVEVGLGHKDLSYIDLILNAKDSRFCPQPAPGVGLTLVKIYY